METKFLDKAAPDMQEYSRTDYQNYKMDKAVAAFIKSKPEKALEIARKNIEKWGWLKEYRDQELPPYMKAILELLDSPVQEIVKVLEAPPTDHHSNWIRSNSPFVGVLSHEERLKILRNAREEYRHATEANTPLA